MEKTIHMNNLILQPEKKNESVNAVTNEKTIYRVQGEGGASSK
jgi:hypothetical protein